MTFSHGATQPVFTWGGKKLPRRWWKNALPEQRKEEVKKKQTNQEKLEKMRQQAGRGRGTWRDR